MTGAQCAAARALLRWKQADLSNAISEIGGKLSVTAITAFERGGSIRASNAELIGNAMQAAGVQFLETGDPAIGPGVAMAAMDEAEDSE